VIFEAAIAKASQANLEQALSLSFNSAPPKAQSRRAPEWKKKVGLPLSHSLGGPFSISRRASHAISQRRRGRLLPAGHYPAQQTRSHRPFRPFPLRRNCFIKENGRSQKWRISLPFFRLERRPWEATLAAVLAFLAVLHSLSFPPSPTPRRRPHHLSRRRKVHQKRIKLPALPLARRLRASLARASALKGGKDRHHLLLLLLRARARRHSLPADAPRCCAGT